MSTRNALSKELSGHIKDVIGKNVKVSLKCMVRSDSKSDKSSRVLVFTTFRLFVMTTKTPPKIENTFNYIEIQAIESKKKNQIRFTVDGRVYTFHVHDAESSDVDLMIMHIGTSVKNIFPRVPLLSIIKKIEVDDVERLRKMYDYNLILENKDPGPCGGYSSQYACMCDYHCLPYREEVAWDIDTIYLSHDTKELSLQDFDHLDGKDLVPIISALIYNAWFTKFRASNIKLVTEACEQILNVMKKSVSIEEIYLDSIGIKWDFVHKLSLALLQNSQTPIHTIDLSHNFIEDKGASHLSGPITKLQKGLIHLNLAHTGLTSKGINTLSHALSLNKFMPSTLTKLDLSGNVFKEDVNNLYNFLAQPNVLTHLNLSGTECSLDTVFGALLRGCCQKLSYLSLAKNQFSTSRKLKDVCVPPSFKQFFSSTIALKFLNLSHNKLPNEALKSLLLGLASNDVATDVELDLSSNDLKASGAVVLESCVSSIRCLTSLDISDNSFDTDLANVITALGRNKSLRTLIIGRNFSNIKSKHISYVLDSIVHMIQEEDSALEYLSLADSKLKSETCLVINALGSNQCLHTIDISGNNMGDAGAKTLAKALQINSKLRTILWDRNNITAQGFQDVAYSLDKNFTLRHMPFPIHDCALALKTHPERTEVALRKIECCLHRNVSPKKYSNSQAFRLQQGFLLSSTHQMVDRMMSQLQETIVKAKSNGENNDNALKDECLTSAENIIKDAESSKQLLSKLHDVVVGREVGNPIEVKLQNLSEQLVSVIDSHIKGTVSCMVKCAKNLCPGVVADENFAEDLDQTCQEKMEVPHEFVNRCLVVQVGADIINKVSEVNLAVAAHISDRITDEVLESLSTNLKSLVDGGYKTGNMTPEILRNKLYNKRDDDSSSKSTIRADSLSETSSSPLATPRLTNKRKSVLTRKLRPQSVIDGLNVFKKAPCLLTSMESIESADQMGSLPSITSSTSSQRLEHLGKARPKRTKTHAPSRPSVLTTTEIIEHVQDIDEGLETFFKRRSTVSSTPDSLSSLSPCEESISESSSHQSNRETSKSIDDAVLKPPDSLKLTAMKDIGYKSRSSAPKNEDKKSDDVENVMRRPVGLSKIGLPSTAMGQGIMADLKAVTDKRMSLSPVSNKSDESPDKERVQSSGNSNPLLGVKLRTTGRAESLKSPTNTFPKTDAEKNVSPSTVKKSDVTSSPVIGKLAGEFNKNADSGCASPAAVRNKPSPALKPKPAPPIAPKPRPKSMMDSQTSDELSDQMAGSPTVTDDATTSNSTDDATNRQSVRSMAAHLEKEKSDIKKKSSSLPRNGQQSETSAIPKEITASPRSRSMYSPKEGNALADILNRDSSSSAPSTTTSASSSLSILSGSRESSVDGNNSHVFKLLVTDKNENVRDREETPDTIACDDIVNV